MKNCTYFIFKIVFLPIFFQFNYLYAQPSLDKTYNNFSFKSDTIETIFKWVANNISYDLEKANNSFFYSHLSEQERINTTLTIQKGVCFDYAILFNALCKKANYESYVITGYTKQNSLTLKDTDGVILSSKIGHAWNIVKIKNKWFCFDPTWAAGGTKDNTFYKSYNDAWFKVPPEEFIITHIPCDPIWQLLEHPIFEKNGTRLITKEYFNIEDSLKSSFQEDILSRQQQLDRIIKYNDGSTFIIDYINTLSKKIRFDKFFLARNEYNKAVDNYNTYIYYRQKPALHTKIKDSEVSFLLESIKVSIREVRGIISTIPNSDTEKETLNKQLLELQNSFDKEYLFFQKYQKLKRFLKIKANEE